MSTTRLSSDGLMRKPFFCELDAYASDLIQMEKDNVPLPKMVEWLKAKGVKTSKISVSRFLKRQRVNRKFDDILNRIALCAQKCDAVENAFAKNPAPEMETIAKVFRVTIMELATDHTDEPALLKLADQLARTAIGIMSEHSRSQFKEREVTIKEQKFAETKKEEQARALEFCLEDSRQFPEVTAMFEAAFAALEKAHAS